MKVTRIIAKVISWRVSPAGKDGHSSGTVSRNWCRRSQAGMSAAELKGGGRVRSREKRPVPSRNNQLTLLLDEAGRVKAL